MKARKAYRYLGREICPVEYADKAQAGFRWFVRSFHSTGTPYDSQHCPHFFTLDAAKESILWARHSANIEANT